MRALRRRLADERGFALILALGVTVVLSISVTTAAYYTSTNSTSSSRSKADQIALSLAEAGLNNAISILNGANTNALSSTALPNACCTGTQTYDNGNAYWWGVLTGNTWKIYGKGVVTNPTGPSTLALSRVVTSSVVVNTSVTQPYNAMAWDYVMSTATGGNPCDQTIANGPNTGNPAIVGTRMYVFGNLCIGTSGGGQGLITGAPLWVRGKVYIDNSASSVGTSGTPIAGAHIGGGCILLGGTLHTPCTGADQVWSNPVPDNTIDMSVTAPVADFTGWYTNGNPGPKNACTTTAGTPPTFENAGSTIFNNSVPTTFELTPAADYTCKTSQGEISWVASTKTLTVTGTIFIDGSVKITNGAMNRYTGQATLYVGGNFYMSAGSKLCALVNGTDCDWANWDPNARLFGIVADATGGQNPTGVSVWMVDAQFQGALYGTGKIRPEGITQTQGPMIASEVQLGYNVNTTSAVVKGFPIITTIPSGFPGVNTVHAVPQAPTTFGG